MQNLKDPILPGFSDEDCFVEKFSSSLIMQTDIRKNTTKRILDRFEENKDAMMDIKVDHFSLSFKPFVL